MRRLLRVDPCQLVCHTYWHQAETPHTLDHMTRFSARANTVIAGIFAVLDTGAFIDRAFIVNRFIEGGFAAHLAERNADKLIAANTDIQHPSRWSVWGTGDRLTYSQA